MKVAFIGTGLMGEPMAERVLSAGYPLTVYNRTSERAAPLRNLGASLAETSDEVVKSADCIVLMLTDAAAIRDVLFNEPARAALKGRTVLQMSTIAPAQSIRLQSDVNAAGGDYLEAPVLGSIPEAKSGKLIVMVGSSQNQFDQWSELLKCFGPEPLRIGPVGKAAALKLALNHLIASLTSSFCLSLGFIERNGIDPNIFMEILRGSALYAPTFDKKLKRFLERDYANPNFPTKHMTKDVGLFLDEAKSLDLDASALEGIRKLFTKALEKGFADSDYSALYEAIAPKADE